MSAVSEEMLIDAVDDTDAPIGKVRRRDVFSLRANFRVVHILVFNSQRELLIQRLALTRTRHPGYWGSSVAGYLYSDENYETAAKRRIEEELGVHGAILYALGKVMMNDEGCQKFIGVFRTVLDGPFEFDHAHIDRVEFLPVPVICDFISSGERSFTPTFLQVFNFYQRIEAQF